jgi:outer membrane receptor for ferrienterochelin and colicins
VEIIEDLEPEKSWNANLNYAVQIDHSSGFTGIDVSAFYTYFTNKIVADFVSNTEKIIYANLDGHAVSKGFTLNSDFEWDNGFRINAGVTLMEVYQVEDSAGQIQKVPQQFSPNFSSTLSLSYVFKKQNLSIDLTGNTKSPMYLPIFPNDYRPERSPWINLINIQVTKGFKSNIEIYAGIKNLLNFVPKNPIMRPFDPFDKQVHIDNPNNFSFDPSYNYASLQGIKGFLGLRIKID